jgi:hypothetical protein
MPCKTFSFRTQVNLTLPAILLCADVSLTSDNTIKLKATGEISVVSESIIVAEGSEIGLVGGCASEEGAGTSEITLSESGIGMIADGIYSN